MHFKLSVQGVDDGFSKEAAKSVCRTPSITIVFPVALDAPTFVDKTHSQGNHTNTVEGGLKSAYFFLQKYFVLMCALMR